MGGQKGLTYYGNVAFDHWALLVDHLVYDKEHIDDDNDMVVYKTKIAIIDSGNSSIQIPNSMFKKIQSKMMSQESSLIPNFTDNSAKLYSPKPC